MKRKLISKDLIISGLNLLIYASSFIVFTLSMINNKPLAMYISGLLMLACLCVSIVHPLIMKTRIGTMQWIGIGLDFLATLPLLIAYIVSIENETLRVVVTAIASTVIGGLITLFGVAITIKYNRMEKEEDYLKSIKPYIFTVSDVTWNSIPKEKREMSVIEVNETNSDLKKSPKNKPYYDFKYILLACSDLSMCSLYGFLINDKYLIKFEYEKVLFKNNLTYIQIEYPFALEEELKSISLIVEDMLKNQYLADLRFSIEKERQCHKIKIESIYEINKLK